MDSKPTTGVGTPQAKITPISFNDGKVRRTNRWLTGAVIVLALAVVGLGAGLIVQAGSEPAATKAPSKVGLADAATVKMLDALNEARTGERVASFYTKDGVLDEVNIGKVTTGRAAIARHWQRYIDQGAWSQRIGPVIQSGDYVAQAMLYNGTSLIVVAELTPDGKISHLWGIAN